MSKTTATKTATMDAALQLEAGGMVLPKTKVDAGATEQIGARTYHHPALGARAVIRLASERLGEAEDVAMEFLGFGKPKVSATLAVQQRRSLDFAAWALINDPGNARFALDLVKRMKKTARQARSKPGHAWDAYTEMAKDLGRSARNLLPAFWEEAGRTFKDLENQTYAGRALNKSLEAERVHAIESDKARRRDVVLEFVLAGCLSGSALSDYGNDLSNQYGAPEAYAIFRDLCTRRTAGGMAQWATQPRDFMKLAKAAKLDEHKEFEAWLEELIDTPAMGRSPHQFWKASSAHCKRIVSRNPAFAVALVRHTRPTTRYYGESKLGPWFELLEEWGVMPYLWEDEHNGAPPLGEPIAHWFGRVLADESPTSVSMLDMLTNLMPRLKKENTPLPLATQQRYRTTTVDIDVLEACLSQGIKVDDPIPGAVIDFTGWLSTMKHPLRNQDIVESAKDDRFCPAIQAALGGAIACRGGSHNRGYRQENLEQRAFPIAAGERPGICALWQAHAAAAVTMMENTGLADFQSARESLEKTLWPDTLRLFPDVAERLAKIDPVAMLLTTLRAGIFDEYGWPGFEKAIEERKLSISTGHYGNSNLSLPFPNLILTDKLHAHVIKPDGSAQQRELRLPAKCELNSVVAVGDDLAVSYRDATYKSYVVWLSNPANPLENGNAYYGHNTVQTSTVLADGSVFNGQQAMRPGDKQLFAPQEYLHDGERFWRLTWGRDAQNEWSSKMQEVDPHTGKEVRDSVPAWFEDPDGGTVDAGSSELLPMPAGAEESPLGVKNGMAGWKVILRSGHFAYAEGIDGRRWEKPLVGGWMPVALLKRPGAEDYQPVTGHGRAGAVQVWDPTGSTVVANLQPFTTNAAGGQVTVLPLRYWHLLKVRDEASSKILRTISHEQCAELLTAAPVNHCKFVDNSDEEDDFDEVEVKPDPVGESLAAVKTLLPTAPERLAKGVAWIVDRAQYQGIAFKTLLEKATKESTGETSASSAVVHRSSDVAALQWGMRHFHMYGENQASVSANLAEAVTFLQGNGKAGPLTRTSAVWFTMMENAALACWQTFWRSAAARLARKDGVAPPWIEFLKFWHEQGLADLPGKFDVLEGHPEGAKKNAWRGFDLKLVPGTSTAIEQGDDKFIRIDGEAYQQGSPILFLRYSTAKKPGKPAGFTITATRPVKAVMSPDDRSAFIAAVEAAGTTLPVPTADELAEVAESLSTSPAEIALLWTGGLNLDAYQANFLPAEIRAALGMKAADASAARQSLRNLNPEVRTALFEAVVAAGAAAPFAADRGPVLRSIEAVWKEKMPKRLALDAALQKKLSAIGKSYRYASVRQEELLSMASDPTNHALLQPSEMEIAINADRNYANLELRAKSGQWITGDLLRNIVQLVGLVHADTPAGDPVRKGMPALIKQVTKLLGAPTTMFHLRTANLHAHGKRKPPTPTEWLNKHVGATKTYAKEACSRADDGLLVGAGLDKSSQAMVVFRSAKLKDDADLARLSGILSLDLGEGYTLPPSVVPAIAALKGPGFQKLIKAILAPGVEKGVWTQNPLVTAPDVVKDIRKKLKLESDAAVLYAQLLALPDPTSANVSLWNGWTAAQFKKAAGELVSKKLVLEAVRARSGRGIFLPGEWSDLKAPWLPIETWKLGHLVEYDIDPKDLCPAGGPMALRPYDELFAAAWKRVTGGDAPRYEEAKRKKKGK